MFPPNMPRDMMNSMPPPHSQMDNRQFMPPQSGPPSMPPPFSLPPGTGLPPHSINPMPHHIPDDRIPPNTMPTFPNQG